MDRPVRVFIVHAEAPRSYTNEKNRKMEVIEGIIADETGHKKVSCYNKAAFPFMKTGHSIMIMNFLNKPKELVIRTGTRVILIPASSVVVPHEIILTAEHEAKLLQAPTAAGNVTVEEALLLPEGTLFNICCKVTKVIFHAFLTYPGQDDEFHTDIHNM